MNDGDEKQQPTAGPIFLQALEEMEPFREFVRGLVAKYRDDGFTNEQARALAVFQLTGYRASSED